MNALGAGDSLYLKAHKGLLWLAGKANKSCKSYATFVWLDLAVVRARDD